MNLIKKSAIAPADPGQKAPAHEIVYQRLKAQILFGDMAPGQAVTIQGLTESLGAGMTPVREAIRRLISDGALTFQGNRRVKVPEMTVADVEQVTFVRTSIEAELARRATKNMDADTIQSLENIDSRLDAAISVGDVEGYLKHNYDFHAAIYAQANAPIMVDLAERLWLRFGPSLRVVCGRFGTQNLPDLHKEMMDGLHRKDAEAVAMAMAQDVEQGMNLVAAVLAEQDAAR
ncbi:GntR family transcriptional regulator [Phaeobacter marinintestinus]|uniref:GntR family transcriptional regulator n=1 Tax=Falsiphaeobacter marinintestinus TaxID=1492905 RepID=UPI0011B3912E|nr:GntR family transcriptional regulator [Phaeobacter marinintestinus]